MGDKMVCLCCDSYTSGILEAFEYGRPCPVCGLSADATQAILAARKKGADEQLVQRCLEAEQRAGKAEAEVALLRYRLAEVERSVAAALKAEPPRWD